MSAPTNPGPALRAKRERRAAAKATILAAIDGNLVNSETLCRQVNVVRRTMYRYVEQLREEGHRIECYAGNGGGYVIRKGRS